MSEPAKLCKDCKHYKASFMGGPQCLHPDALRSGGEYLVDGRSGPDCSRERDPFYAKSCGPHGKNFEQRPTFRPLLQSKF